jgi:hypothetical protein
MDAVRIAKLDFNLGKHAGDSGRILEKLRGGITLKAHRA